MTAISSLIAVISYAVALCGIIPLFPWLSTAPRLLLATGLAAGVWQSFRGSWPLKNWLLNASVIPFFLYYAIQFNRANLVQSVVNMLAVMLAVRLAGEKNSRHYMQMQVLSLFCLASSSLFDLSPVFLVYLALMLFMVTVLLVLLTFYDQDSRMTLSRNDVRGVVAAGLLIPIVSIPLLLVFFPLLPRTPIPLWNFSAAPTSRPTGFSDKVEPGASANTFESPLLAFRAELPRQPLQKLYWRGAVFNRFDGTSWVRDEAVPPERLVYGSPRIHQVIYLEPRNSRFLIALDAQAPTTAIRARFNQDGTIETRFSINNRSIYKADSFVGGLLPVSGRIDRDFYLRLPGGIPDRIVQLAGEIRTQGNNDGSRIELLEQYFRNGDYAYTAKGLPTGKHALEQFLFQKKQGNCEFFASAFAILSRSVGVPARLVGGYLGGEYNDVGGYYTVSEGLAHVWVEVFIHGKGWQRIDPSSFATNAGAVWGASRPSGFIQRLRMTFDALDHAWNRSVVGYDFEQQAGMARDTARRMQALTLKGMRKVFMVLALFSGVFLMLYLLLKRRILFPPREERLLRGFYRYLDRECGIHVQPGRRGLFELAGLSGNERVAEFVAIYAGALYRDRKLTDAEYGHLRKLLRSGFAVTRSDSLSE